MVERKWADSYGDDDKLTVILRRVVMGLFQAKSKRIIEELNTQNVEQFTTLLNNQILDAIKRNHEELVDHLVEQAHSKMRFYGTTFVMRPDVLQKYNQFKQQILDREKKARTIQYRKSEVFVFL